jgi:hypothetical protein
MKAFILEKCQIAHHSKETWQDVAPPFKFSRSSHHVIAENSRCGGVFQSNRNSAAKIFKIEFSPQLAK